MVSDPEGLTPIAPMISRRRRGNSSRSNQGLAVSQALLRQEGWGNAMRRGCVSASSSSRQRLTVAVMLPPAAAPMCQRWA